MGLGDALAEDYYQQLRLSGPLDWGEGGTARQRQVAREVELIRQNDEIIALQRETNRLLALLVERLTGETAPPQLGSLGYQ